MGTVYKKSATRALPPDAEIFTRKGERFARWKAANGQTRTAPVTTGRDGQERVVIVAKTYMAKYRDGSGVVREVTTGCRDEMAARQVLAELERRADKVRSGLRTAAEDAVVDHLATALAEHIEAYKQHQTASGVTRARIRENERQLRRIGTECGFRRLADLDAGAFVRWLTDRQREGMAAATRNEYRKQLVAFSNWCVRSNRLVSNPFSDVPKADEKTDVRRRRRSLTENELRKLLDVARSRPLVDKQTIRRGKRKGEATAELRPATIELLERLGRERALIYKTMVLTGLRKNELASLTVGQLHLDGPLPYAELAAADEKNREGSQIPLRADLAADLRDWLAEKLQTMADAVAGGTVDGCLSIAARTDRLPAASKVFCVPSGLVRILDRDLKRAGIPKTDERGRTVDVHALRHSFGTLLSKGGVAPRTAQAAMRHSTIDLTMNVYTDPKLLDVHGALDALPDLPLTDGPQTDRIAVSRTGTDDFPGSQFAPQFAPTTDKSVQNGSIPVKTAVDAKADPRRAAVAVKSCGDKRKDSPTKPVNESSKWARQNSKNLLARAGGRNYPSLATTEDRILA